MIAFGPSRQDHIPYGLWSLWDMLQSYFPIYQIAIDLQQLRRTAEVYEHTRKDLDDTDTRKLAALLESIQRECLALSLIPPHEMASRLIERGPRTYATLVFDLDHLDGSLNSELKKEAVFRIRPELKEFYERDHLFGENVSISFPSCERDIRKAGSCYALEQEDASVHHLMMVLER